MNAPSPLYVAARRALLNALEALGPHLDALTIVGAQAVYLHAGPGTLSVAPYTTDGDIVIDPAQLGSDPQLDVAMRSGRFDLDDEPGIWTTEIDLGTESIDVPVDLIVPDGAAPSIGRRGARLGTHGKRAARRVTGLEAALIDRAPLTITALESRDERVITVNVAGPAALLVAKAHKIHDRAGSDRRDRLEDKDGSDVLRLMQTTDPRAVGKRLATLATNPLAGAATTAALAYVEALFGRRGGEGVGMATRALRAAMPAARVEVICTAYTAALLQSAAGD